jgi:hypothetical protein
VLARPVKEKMGGGGRKGVALTGDPLIPARRGGSGGQLETVPRARGGGGGSRPDR